MPNSARGLQMIQPDNGPVQTTGELVDVSVAAFSLPMMLYKPIAAGRYPAVVVCPGGTGAGLFEIMEWAGARLRAAGFVVLTMSWRAPSPLDDPADIAAAVGWLATQEFVDPTRIAIFGSSRGANAALRAAAADGRIRAAITLGAATDFAQLAVGAASYAPSRFEMLKGWLGDPITQRPFYERVQAINVAHLIRQPVLLIHGQHDFHCPFEQSVMMREKLLASGNQNAELELLPWVGHYGDLVPNGHAFNHITALMISFLQRHLEMPA